MIIVILFSSKKFTKESVLQIPEFEIINESPGQKNYPIRPKDIDISRDLSGKFGINQIRIAAANLIKFCQYRKGWLPFSIQDLLDYHRKTKHNTKMIFFGLLGHWQNVGGMGSEEICLAPPYLVICHDGLYRVTNYFIEHCAKK